MVGYVLRVGSALGRRERARAGRRALHEWLIRLVGTLCREQNDESLVGGAVPVVRRFSSGSIATCDCAAGRRPQRYCGALLLSPGSASQVSVGRARAVHRGEVARAPGFG